MLEQYDVYDVFSYAMGQERKVVDQLNCYQESLYLRLQSHFLEKSEYFLDYLVDLLTYFLRKIFNQILTFKNVYTNLELK